MVGKVCQWANCKSDSRRPETLDDKLTFIPFIKPSQNRERCLKWIAACGRPLEELNIDNIKHKYICSKHFQEVVNGKPSTKYPDPTADRPPSHHSPKLRSKTRNKFHADSGEMKEEVGKGQGGNEEKQEVVMRLTFDESGEGISEEIHTSLTRALMKNETQLCNNPRCVNQTNSLIKELQHALWVERKFKEKIQYLRQIAKVNLDLLSICVDEKKNPVVKEELNRVYKLVQAVIEMQNLFDNDLSCSNDEDVDDRNRGNWAGSLRETRQSRKWRRRTQHKRSESLSENFTIKKETEHTDELIKNQNYSVEDSDLRDVDSIMNVVNSFAFKTIEENETLTPIKGFSDGNNVIPLLDFKDIPMLNVTNLPWGLSLVNNSPVINLNTENGADLSSSSLINSDTLNTENAATKAKLKKLNSSNIPILNGPLLSFVNKITSPKPKPKKTKTPPQRKKRKRQDVSKRKRRDVSKRKVKYAEDDEDTDDYDNYTELLISKESSPPQPLSPLPPPPSPPNPPAPLSPPPLPPHSPSPPSPKIEKLKLKIKTSPTKSTSEKSNKTKGSKAVKMEVAKPLNKRQDPLRGVTASRVMCEVCGKLIACSSTKSWHFQSHMRKFHTGEKPERCEICDKRFHDLAALRSHMTYIHSQGRPHQCAVCGKSFKSRENLRKHGLVHTTEGSLFTCLACNKKFKRSDCLKNHQRIFHKRKIEGVKQEPFLSSSPPPQLVLPPQPPPPPPPTQPPPHQSSPMSSQQPPSSNPLHIPPEAHSYPPTASSFLHDHHHGDSSHDIPWDGRAVPIPPVTMYGLPGMHPTHMEFPPWHPLK